MDMEAASSDKEVPCVVNPSILSEMCPDEETYRLEYLHGIPLPPIILEKVCADQTRQARAYNGNALLRLHAVNRRTSEAITKLQSR
jgi:hypothetical protein